MKTSIIILTHNKLEYTQLCINSIRDFTEVGSYEIIIVDNNSTDGTVEWLSKQPDILSIFNSENLGFPKGCNQGIEASTGDNILLLNNDTIATPRWLENLVTCLYSSDNVGAVGPLTSNCSNYQVLPAGYTSMDGLVEFADNHNVSNSTLWEYRLRLVGFCMLIKMEVVNKIGLLDEIFSPGNYEDDDYSFRIRLAGYRLILCKDTYIHHYGSVSFKDNPDAFKENLRANEIKFLSKWRFPPYNNIDIRKDLTEFIKNSSVEDNFTLMHIGCAGGGTLLDIKNAFPASKLYGIDNLIDKNIDTSYFANISVGSLEQLEKHQVSSFDFIVTPVQIDSIDSLVEVISSALPYLKDTGKLIISINLALSLQVEALLENLNSKFQKYALNLLDSIHGKLISMTICQSIDDISHNILSREQNHVTFTGERLVINETVKKNYLNVLEEHMERYKVACTHSKEKHILDAACGSGYGSKMLKDAGGSSVIGVDICEESIKNATSSYKAENITFQYGDVNNLNFEDESFDLVVSFETIEHIKDGSVWIKESSRLLKDSGLFIVSTPNRYLSNPGLYMEEAPLNPYHCYEYNLGEFVGELLKEYDILELYGQTFIKDSDLSLFIQMRSARSMDVTFLPTKQIAPTGYALIPLSDVKNAQPLYLVAVCRKKS